MEGKKEDLEKNNKSTFIHFGVSALGLGVFAEKFSRLADCNVYIVDCINRNNYIVNNTLKTEKKFLLRSGISSTENRSVNITEFVELHDYSRLEQIFAENRIIFLANDFTEDIYSESEFQLFLDTIDSLIEKRDINEIHRPFLYLKFNNFSYKQSNYPQNDFAFDLTFWSKRLSNFCIVECFVEKIYNSPFIDEQGNIVVFIDAYGVWVINLKNIYSSFLSTKVKQLVSMLNDVTLAKEVKEFNKHLELSYYFDTALKIVAYLAEKNGFRLLANYLKNDTGIQVVKEVLEEIIYLNEIGNKQLIMNIRFFSFRMSKSFANIYRILPYSKPPDFAIDLDFYREMQLRFKYNELGYYDLGKLRRTLFFFESIERELFG